MKNLLPYLGAVALGASFVIATNDKAAAQDPQQSAPVSKIAEIRFIATLQNPASPVGKWDGVKASEGTLIEAKGNEFVVTSKSFGNLHIPMSAVAWYKIAGEN